MTWPQRIREVMGHTSIPITSSEIHAILYDEDVPNLRQKIWCALLRMERRKEIVRVKSSPKGTSWKAVRLLAS